MSADQGEAGSWSGVAIPAALKAAVGGSSLMHEADMPTAIPRPAATEAADGGNILKRAHVADTVVELRKGKGDQRSATPSRPRYMCCPELCHRSTRSP